MGDAQAAGEGPRCVGCGGRVKTLFVQYSPGNIRLMKCDNCKAVADPYIECEFMIILIDLVLHKTRAYRHVLFNKLSMGSSVDKGILYRSTLIHIALDAFRISFSKGNRADGASSRSIFSTISNCTEVIGDALLGNIIFMIMLLLGVRFILKLSFDIIRYRDVLFAVIISSYFKLFLFTMMVWEFPSSVIFIVEMFVLSSNVVALRVSKSPLLRSLLTSTCSKVLDPAMDPWDAMSLNSSRSSSSFKHGPNLQMDRHGASRDA